MKKSAYAIGAVGGLAATMAIILAALTAERELTVFPIKSFSTDGYISVTTDATEPLLAKERGCVDFQITGAEGLYDRTYTGPFQDGDWGAWMGLSSAGSVLTSRLNPLLDPNHTDGFGKLQLLAYTYLNGSVDLRDAELSFKVRGRNFKRGSTEFYPWVQSCRYGENESPTGMVCANWALSAQPLGGHLESGEWESVSVSLINDADQWSYGGNRLEDGPNRYRYQYFPLAQALANPINFHFVLALPKGGKPATGAVQFKDIRICERAAEHETADVSAPIRSLLMEYAGQPGASTSTVNIPPVVSVAEREGYDIRVRVNPLGVESRLMLRQGDTTLEDIYIGSQKTSRDVNFRASALRLCAEGEVVVSNQYGRRTYPLERMDGLFNRWKQTAACWWAG